MKNKLKRLKILDTPIFRYPKNSSSFLDQANWRMAKVLKIITK
ncbi:unnamed protein product [Tenebrio molitor]|nr:unnamed protein product [Tenebrio molitor]CAH1381063.1 unnamed protein product [Tenebrio molitor]